MFLFFAFPLLMLLLYLRRVAECINIFSSTTRNIFSSSYQSRSGVRFHLARGTDQKTHSLSCIRSLFVALALLDPELVIVSLL
jgi:hypothetical protein